MASEALQPRLAELEATRAIERARDGEAMTEIACQVTAVVA